MKTIVLLDPHRIGHHLMYLRLFSKILLELGHSVIAFCPEPENLTQWISVHCSEQAANLHVFQMQEIAPAEIPLLGRLPQPFNVVARWRQAAATVKIVRARLGRDPDLVLIGWLDAYLSSYLPPWLLDRIFSYPWAGLYFKARLPFGSLALQKQGWGNFHTALNTRHCCGVGVLDEEIERMLQHQSYSPIITFPDITDESEPDRSFALVQQLQQQAQGRKIIGLFGALSKRKGLLTLLEVARRSQAQPWLFAFVGKLSIYGLSTEEQAQIHAIVQAQPENCFFHLELIPDEPQYNALVETCDILFAAYEDFPYSSNMLTKAALFKKPVIASEEFCVGERVRQFRLGYTIPQGNVDQCIEALHNLSQELDLDLINLQPDFGGYRQHHSVDQVRISLQEILGNV